MNAQQSAISLLEQAGFECVSNFAASPDPECSDRVYVFSKRVSRHQSRQCEVDPDGTCNGMMVDDYLATLKPVSAQSDTCPRGYMGMRD